ncbi:hypothetical protein T4C_1809, partial [Trichinella pseudospiralis]
MDIEPCIIAEKITPRSLYAHSTLTLRSLTITLRSLYALEKSLNAHCTL